MTQCEIDNMDIDAVIAAIEYTITECNDSVYRIFNVDGDVVFASPNDEIAYKEYNSYLTEAQKIALQIEWEVDMQIAAENAAERLLGYTP